MLLARLCLVGAVALLSLAPAGAQAPAAAGESDRLNSWFEAKFKEQLSFSPIQQTFLGGKSGGIDDMSMAAQDKLLAWRRASVAELKSRSTTPG